MFRSMQELPHRFRAAVQAYLGRTGVSPSRLGAEALGDPCFVPRLMRGRAPRLDTADRVLAHMGEAPLGPAFRAEVDAFLSVTRTKAYLLGALAVGDPSFVSRLRRGVSPRLDTARRVREWMSAHCGAAERGAIGALVAASLSPPAAGAAVPPRKFENDDKGGDAPMTERDTKYLDTREAADFLGLSNRTLDRYRVTGEGPAFHKFGSRIRYALADLEAWAGARRMRSTSEEGAAGRRGL